MAQKQSPHKAKSWSTEQGAHAAEGTSFPRTRLLSALQDRSPLWGGLPRHPLGISTFPTVCVPPPEGDSPRTAPGRADWLCTVCSPRAPHVSALWRAPRLTHHHLLHPEERKYQYGASARPSGEDSSLTPHPSLFLRPALPLAARVPGVDPSCSPSLCLLD